MPDQPKMFDPTAQLADVQALFTTWMNPWKSIMSVLPTRYEPVDPVVQEIVILATIHNMASLLQNPEALKSQLNVELAERAKKLAAR